MVTAQGKMDLEKKGRQSYQGWMTARLLAFSNGDLQALYDRSNGFYRRQLILTTRDRPTGRADDPDLAEKLCAEIEGIFLWAFAGLRRLIANRFQFTESPRTLGNREYVKSKANNAIEFMEHRYDILIVKDFSRFSRRNSRGLVELEDLRDAGARIISIGDDVDFPNDDDWLKIQLQFLLNEMPVTDTSKKVKSVIRRRQEDAKWICAAPYGYIVNRQQQFEIVPTEADIVRRIFSLYLGGWGYKKIANWLTDEGIPTPRMEDHPETIGCYQNCDICVLRSGKARKNDPPIPKDIAPISSHPRPAVKKPEPEAFEAMEKAAQRLTPVTLELGGKSPVIVDGTADLRTAARRVMFGKVLNAGQTCVEPDYAFVREDALEPFLAGCRAALAEFFPNGDFGEMPVIVNEKHYARVKALLSSGRAAIGGGFDDARRFIEPTVLVDVGLDSPVMYRAAFRAAFGEDALPLYASKACCFKQMYRLAAEEGLGVDVVSAGEIFTARSAGFPMERAFFHSNNKTDRDIAFAMKSKTAF